jgi:hypothetical protein
VGYGGSIVVHHSPFTALLWRIGRWNDAVCASIRRTINPDPAKNCVNNTSKALQKLKCFKSGETRSNMPITRLEMATSTFHSKVKRGWNAQGNRNARNRQLGKNTPVQTEATEYRQGTCESLDTLRLFVLRFFVSRFHRVFGAFPGGGSAHQSRCVFDSFCDHLRYQTGTRVFVRSGTVDDDRLVPRYLF